MNSPSLLTSGLSKHNFLRFVHHYDTPFEFLRFAFLFCVAINTLNSSLAILRRTKATSSTQTVRYGKLTIFLWFFPFFLFFSNGSGRMSDRGGYIPILRKRTN